MRKASRSAVGFGDPIKVKDGAACISSGLLDLGTFSIVMKSSPKFPMRFFFKSKSGGMENGFFSYENQTETVRLAMEALKNNPEFASMPVIGIPVPTDEESTVGRLFNPKLLPAFDRIAKYFGFAVASAATTADGFHMKVFAPKPAGLK